MKFIVSMVLGVALLRGCGLEKPLSGLHGTLLAPPMEIADYSFQTADGILNLSDFQGKYVVLAFGYTFCPDACPTTMARLARTVSLMGDKAGSVQVMLVSVDPPRDTPALLKKYAQNFNPDFIGASVAEPNAASLFKTFGIYHERSDSASTTDYLINHTTSTLVLDPAGNWRLVWNFEVTPEEMASDLHALIRHNPGAPRSVAQRVTDVWTRPYQAEAGIPTAIYLTLHNPTPSPIKFTGANISLADTVEIHASTLKDGVMRMQPVPFVEIASGTSTSFSPGGHHLMVKGLQQSLLLGDRMDVTLTFENGNAPATAIVRWE